MKLRVMQEDPTMRIWTAAWVVAVAAVGGQAAVIVYDDAARNGWTYTDNVSTTVKRSGANAATQTTSGWDQMRFGHSASTPAAGNGILSAWINFVPDATYNTTEIERVDVVVDGTNREYKTSTATILVDGVQDASGRITFDADPGTWQHLEIDLGSHGSVTFGPTTAVGRIDVKSSSALAWNLYLDDMALVPEPATLALLAIGGAAGLRRRRR